MRTHIAERTTPAPVTASTGPAARPDAAAGRFLAELGAMCAVMCIGGSVLSWASFAAASGLGYPNLSRQAPELSVAIIAVCLSVPMAAYMAVRGHGRRHNLAMTAGTIAVAVMVIALLASGVIPVAGPRTWHSLFGLVCAPACAVMIVEMLISFNMYSGRTSARRPHHAGDA
jgi:hypothetical protein